jgi:hypothetical protein
LSFVFEVYNASTPAVEARLLLWRDGKPLLKGEPAPLMPADTSDPKRLLATGSLRLGAGMPPGLCLPQIIARDKAKKNAIASQWIDFEVVQ